MKNDRQISDDMLVKYLLGEVSETEQSSVQQWIKESAAHKSEFDSFRLLWEQSKKLATTSTIDENEAWNRFMVRTTQAPPATKTIPMPKQLNWLRAAAILILLSVGSWMTWSNFSKPELQVSNKPKEEIKAPRPNAIKPQVENSVQQSDNSGQAQISTAAVGSEATHTSQPVAIHVKQSSARPIAYAAKSTKNFKNDYTKESLTKINPNDYVCNSTPYPFEICIKQTVKCNNEHGSAISTCSVIEPDQSGRLHYKALDKIAKNCKATIDEIRITKMNTGETIVLNDHSTPSTAQNFFNHLTGKQKGDVYAGMFPSDCDENANDCGLTFDSNFGNFILQ